MDCKLDRIAQIQDMPRATLRRTTMKYYGTGFNPKCTACGNYLLPCTATASGIHPEVRDGTTGVLIARADAGA